MRQWRRWREKRYTTLGAGASPALDAGGEWERRRPARSASLEADVLVPGAQATITGLVGGLLAGGVAAAMHFSHPWALGAIAGAATLGAAWVVLLRDQRALLWEIENVTGRDLNGDGVAGRPQPRIINAPVRVEIQERKAKGRGSLRFIDLPAKPEQLRVLAVGVLNGAPMAEASWTGKRRPFSRRQFNRLRDEMLRRGLAVWVNPAAHAQGVQLTSAGRAVFRRLAETRPALPGAHAGA